MHPLKKQTFSFRYLKTVGLTTKALAVFLFIICSIASYSQSGPGGHGQTDGSSELVLWLRADAGVEEAAADPAEDTDAVSSWLDQSGYGYNAVTAATSPVFTLANASFNNLPTITFAGGATEFLLVEDDADEAPQLDNTSELSIFYVFNESDISGLNAHISKRDGNGVQQSYLAYESTNLNSRVNANNDPGSVIAVSTTYINAITYENGNFDHFLNQTSGGGVSGGTATIPNNDSDLHIGTLNDGDNRNLNGDIAEVIIFREYLTNAERIVVESYLASKYGITLTSDFWDETTYAAYDNEIAGIGQHTDGTVANSATSAVLTVSGGDDRANGEWLFLGHDNGDFATYTSTEIVTGASHQRLAREWVINETNELGNVTVFIDAADLPATGVTNSDFYLLVDTDGDADFADATAHLMVPSGAGYGIDIDLDEGDHVAIAFEEGDASEIWYSYLSGNWNDAGTWTLDGAISPLYLNPSNKVPSVGDSVVVQSGRTVTVDMNDAVVTRLEIVGTLDIAATSGHNFGVLAGSGTLRMSGAAGVDNYPSGNDALFYDADEGGTLEIYGSGIELNQIRRANNLVLNMTGASVATMTGDSIYVNGNMTITEGFFQFNDNSATNSLAVEVRGNLLVAANGGIDVGTANARHELNLYGDFTNQGDVDFTNRVTQITGSEATDGIVDANFVSPNQDQVVSLENNTDFYRIEVNKGVDDTYVVDFSADNASFFNLYGYSAGSLGGPQSATNDNALGLIYGTIKIGNNVSIPTLSTSGNYSIFAGAQIWVDGGSVTQTSGNAIVLYGAARVSAGTMTIAVVNGITTRDNGLLTIEGGTVTTNQLKTSTVGSTSLGGLVMSGGIFNVTGVSSNTSHYTFSLTYPGNVFNMSGGTINLSGVNTTGGIFINSDDENINVTGGTVNLDVTNGNNMTITSRAPFFNLNVLESTASAASALISAGSSGTGGGIETLTPTGLTIINDFTVDNTGGNGTTFDANSLGLSITGSLIIEAGSVVDFSGMNVKFEGAGASSLDIQFASTLLLDSLELNKNEDFSILDIQNGQTTAIQIDEYLNIAKGQFDIGAFDLTVNGNVNVADTIGSDTSTGTVTLSGGSAQTITSSSGAIYDLDINNANGVSLAGDVGIVNQLNLNAGIFDLNTSKLTTGSEVATSGTFSSTLMIQTDGNASDGGLEYYFDGATADPASILYPIGTDANTTTRYTPVTMDLSSIAASDDGYVGVSVADATLQTTDQTGGNILSYYWRSNNREFGTAPTVQYTFIYATSDDDATDEGNYVPGKVLDESPFTRSSEMQSNLTTGTNTITFDNDGGGGFALENANYTAGLAARFVGSPTIYYSRRHDSGGGGLNWNDTNDWSLTGHDGAAAGSSPGSGDVVIIGAGTVEDNGDVVNDTGFLAGQENSRHQMVAAASRTVAEVIFDSNPAGTAIGNSLSRIRLNNTGFDLTAGKISGHGELMISISNSDESMVTADLGDFVEADTSSVFYDIRSGGTVVISNLTEFPGVRFFGNNNNPDVSFANDITAASFLIDRTSNLEVRSNMTVAGSVQVGNNGAGSITFPDDGTNHTFAIGGDLTATSSGTNAISTENAGSDIHTLSVAGNIALNNISTFSLMSASGSNVNLELSGTGEHSFANTAGVSVDLYRIVMNKGTDTTSVFTLNTDLSLSGTTTASPQAIELQNGKLVLNNAALNLELADNSDFSIPSGAGLEVTDGTVTSTGANLVLNGLLRVNGGTATLSSSDIEYSSTGAALLSISSGTLNVGGQVRRSTTSTTGILKYRQTGGDVDIATDNASTSARAAFEVLNSGSEFTLTGGTFNIEQGVTGDSNESLQLDPETYDVSGSTITIFENLGADYGASYFNVSSTIALNNFTIANSIDLPDVQLYTQNLEVNDLTINTNQTLVANGFNVISNGNFSNAGTYTNVGTETIFAGAGAQAITGAGTYDIYTLRKSGSGTTTASVSLDLTNDFYLTGGTFDVGANSLSLQNDAYIQSTFSNTAGSGLVFNGTANQNLNGLSNNSTDIGTITISNPSGVDIPDGNGFDFNITQELRLNGGVFNIGGSLVTLAAGAPVTPVSAFNVGNMVQTNSSFTDNGLKIDFFDVAADTTVFFPIGELKYTPVQFELDMGTTEGGIRVRPANERHPTIINDAEPATVPDPEIDDTQNVLQYHWIVVAETLTNATGTATFFYDHSDITNIETDTANFISARLLANGVNWDKFAPTLFLGASQSFEVPLSTATSAEITGDYTAGAGSSDGINADIEGAIPDQLAQYESVISGSGNYSTAVNWNPLGGSPAVTDGVGPVGAQVIVSSGDILTVDVSNVRLYSTEIEEGGTLVIPAGTIGVRLGTVSGSGTIQLEDNELLPTGEYTSFLACDGGALQYSGTTDYSVLSGISQIRKVTFDGTGTRTLPNNALTVCDSLIINGPTVNFDAGQTYAIGDADTDRLEIQAGSLSVTNASTVNLEGDFIMSGGTFTGETSTILEITDDVNFSGGTLNWNGTDVTFDGTTEQLVDGTFTGAASFDDVLVNNSSTAGVSLNSGDIEIDGILTLTDGLVNTSSTETLTLTSGANWTGASSASYITGPIRKDNIAIASTYEFPVGKAARYAPVSIVNVGTGSDDWTAEYFTSTGGTYSSATFDGTDPGSGFNALTRVESTDRWEITSVASNTAQVRATYGPHNGFADTHVRLVWWDDEAALDGDGADNRWENQGGQIAGTASSGTVTSEASVFFSTRQFGLGYAPESVLPVELVSFAGELDGKEIRLKWTTASELNNDFFDVQHSTDGEVFKSIGQVSGNGTTSQAAEYVLIHKNPQPGINFYRLRQVDFDGDEEVHYIIQVTNDFFYAGIEATMFPNPARPENMNIRVVTEDISSPILIKLVGLTGQVYYQKVVRNSLQFEEKIIPMQEMKHGIYFLTIKQGGRVTQKKVVIKK